ncbi:MAG: SH3 domain-containing protein [Muribaculaceae bacterium]|nr:SH3 domain-containing protein [Muribaculaceae bacterium]
MKKFVLSTLIVLSGMATAYAQSMYVMSMKGNVNLRTAPSTSAAKVGTLTPADLLPCTEELDGWYKVDYNGKEAYVSQSVAATCDAVIPEGMFGKDLESSKPWDKIRHQGSLTIKKIDNEHAVIYMDWMRINMPAESYTYIATIKDGKVIATHYGHAWVDTEMPMSEILADMLPLEENVPVGYNEFNNTLYFEGAEFSEYE